MNQSVSGLFAPRTVKNYDYWFIFLLSYLYIRWDLLWNGTGISILLFTLLFCSFFFLRLDVDGRITDENRKASRPWLPVIALSSFSAAWFDDTPLGRINFLFLTVAVLYWLSILTGTRLVPAISPYLPLDLLIPLVRLPFANFGQFLRRIFAKRIPSAATEHAELSTKSIANHRSLLRNVLLVLCTLCMIAPLLLIVLNLLASADEEFMVMIAHMIDDFFALFDDLITFDVFEILWTLLLALPVACYLFGLLWAYTHPKQAKGLPCKEASDRWILALRITPRIVTFTVLLSFTIIYLLFLGLQVTHLSDALTQGLPETTTYSKFAREGFFELCAVAFINLMILTGVWLLAKRNASDDVPVPLRLMLSLLSVQTILLIITAMVKMGLYIQVYGLTRLRIYTFWFMIWLLLVFVILALATARKRGVAATNRFSPAKLLTILTVVMFLALNYLNVDAVIVRDHIARAENRPLQGNTLDVGYLWSLSGNARLELVKYFEGEVPEELIPHGYWDGGDWHRATITSLRLNSQLKTP